MSYDLSKIVLKPMDVDIVIYHRGCCDGFGSAFTIWKYFQINNPKKRIKYMPYLHNYQSPDVTGKNVVICDFSFKYPVLTKMINQAKSLLVLDHHVTAQKELEKIDDAYKIFDVNHSGVYITWAFFFPSVEMPLFLKYIEDRDIWAKKWTTSQLSESIISSCNPKFWPFIRALPRKKNAEKSLSMGNAELKLFPIHIQNHL